MTSYQTRQLTSDVLQQCLDLGFASAGVTEADPSRWSAELIQWLEQGRHGEMHYLANNVELRCDPRKLLPDAKSVICVADRYHNSARDQPSGNAAPAGRIARYARGDDYHVVMKKRLHAVCDHLQQAFPSEKFRACVDTAPVMEREFAQRAGLGAVGKNTLLIQPGVGSYLLLGEIVTTLKLEPNDRPIGEDPCGTCTRCIEACPTQAITPWSVDATRCISYLTIEHRGPISPEAHQAMGDWIFGCDICQDVCPHNQPTRRSRSRPVHSAYSPRHRGFDLLDVLHWDEQSRRDAFIRSSMKRAKLSMMKRNALIAAGNALRAAEHPKLRQRVEAIAADPDEDHLVRTTAVQVLDALRENQSG